MLHLKALAFSALAAAAVSGFSGAPAQVSISIGAPPMCPYGYYDFAPYNCAPYGYYGPDWFDGGVFIGAGPGFMVRTDFMGTSTTTMILVTVTTDPIPRAGSSLTTISTQTKRGTGTAMWVMPAMMAVVNTLRAPEWAAVTLAVAESMAAESMAEEATTRERTSSCATSPRTG